MKKQDRDYTSLFLVLSSLLLIGFAVLEDSKIKEAKRKLDFFTNNINFNIQI